MSAVELDRWEVEPMEDGAEAPATALDSALSYAKRGWLVLPLHTPNEKGECSCGSPDCGSVGKHPRTAHGVKDATCDESAITGWWARWPEANVGLATGKASGLVVLDIDPRHGGQETLMRLLAEGCGLRATVQSSTGGGGWHLLFGMTASGECRVMSGEQTPAVGSPLTPTNSPLLRSGPLPNAPGLDVKAEGGYIVAPPSLHASGKRYTWREGHSPDERTLKPVPEWIVKAVSGSRLQVSGSTPAVGAASAATVPRPQTPSPLPETRNLRPETPFELIPQGTRNETLASLAGTMRRRSMSAPAIEAALLADNALRCQPPLPDREVRAIAQHIAQYPPEPSDRAVNLPLVGPYSDFARIRQMVRYTTWLWPDWLPEGCLTVLGGDQESGKSFLSLRLAHSVVTGSDWPDGKPGPREPAPVLWVDAESCHATTVERAEKMGLPLEQLKHLPNHLDGWHFNDAEHLLLLRRYAIQEEVRAIIVDSLSTAYSGDENSSDIRHHLEGLAAVARDLHIVVLLVHHLRKPGPLDTNEFDLDRLRGSSAIKQLARSILGIDRPDPTRDARRVQVAKCNFLAQKPPSLGYELRYDCQVCFGEAPRQAVELSRQQEAELFLLEALAEGPRPMNDLKSRAEATGVSSATLYRAKKALRILSRRAACGGGWCWELPPAPAS